MFKNNKKNNHQKTKGAISNRFLPNTFKKHLEIAPLYPPKNLGVKLS